MIDQATRGLVNMGFAKSEATRAVDGVVRKHPQGDVQRLLREALAVLT
jgi:Holliday junction resolvasome RuvABC DNA-binding subunit